MRRMEMSQSFSPFQSSRPGSPTLAKARGAAIYTHRDDVTSDPKLTTAEKRAVFAPSLRRLDSSAVVEVGAIQQALALLDGRAPDRRDDCKRLPPSRRRRSVISRWLRRVANGSNDNDDDPPPAPAGFGIPFRPTFVAAHRTRPERGPGLACASG